MREMKKSVIFAGEAGKGIDRTAVLFGKALVSTGCHVFIYRDYASLIRGGHNFSTVTFSTSPIGSHEAKADLLVAFDGNSIKIHSDDLKANGKVIAAEDFGLPTYKVIGQREFTKAENVSVNFGNNVALGATAKHFGMPFGLIKKIIVDSFSGDEAAVALRLARSGYDLTDIFFNDFIKGSANAKLIDGSEAAALGTIAAGKSKSFYYPMTPATGYFSKLESFGGEVFQVDDEIAAVNMALGASFAEGLAVTGSSGGGVALMAEAMSFAGMAELPLVVYVAQRQGPSTGVPTYSGQGDLKFILNIGPGEFPKIVSIPGDAEEAFYRAAEASYLSKKFRTQSFVLSDKHVAESYFSTPKLVALKLFKKDFTVRPKGAYNSYSITETGVSPMAMPGEGVIVRATSYEHDEAGFTTEDPKMILAMNDKRLRKSGAIADEVRKFNPVASYGKGDNLIIFAGSPKGAILDALLDLPGTAALQIKYLEPFPTKEVKSAIKRVKRITTVESNATGLLSQIIAEKTGYFSDKILKYDGRPFTAEEVALRVRKIFR